MSIDINWQTLTEGPDGENLAEQIRAFVHERFQNIPLPSLIRSIKVTGFDFGEVAPQIAIKDICEPLADFYENDEDGDEENVEEKPTERDHDAALASHDKAAGPLNAARERMKASARSSGGPRVDDRDSVENTAFNRTATPGFFHGTSNIGYFHLPLSAGLSGTNTPLAAVAGAHFSQGAPSHEQPQHHPSDSFSSISPPPTLTPPSRPTSRDASFADQPRGSAPLDDMEDTSINRTSAAEHDRRPEDLQIVFHVAYSGNVRLSMTADVFLDYPMPSFVGIPLKLNITGLTFDGVGIVAYIKRRAHLCFLAPEDAEALVGGEAVDLSSPSESPSPGPDHDQAASPRKVGGLIEDIKIESEMGETVDGKQVLKNVGKIEKFLLEQVQRIFEDEFVYPSFWTILV